MGRGAERGPGQLHTASWLQGPGAAGQSLFQFLLGSRPDWWHEGNVTETEVSSAWFWKRTGQYGTCFLFLLPTSKVRKDVIATESMTSDPFQMNSFHTRMLIVHKLQQHHASSGPCTCRAVNLNWYSLLLSSFPAKTLPSNEGEKGLKFCSKCYYFTSTVYFEMGCALEYLNPSKIPAGSENCLWGLLRNSVMRNQCDLCMYQSCEVY